MLKKILERNGFNEYPEQLTVLAAIRDVFSHNISPEDIRNLINKILVETGEIHIVDNRVYW